MFDHFGAKNGVERARWHWNVGDVTNVIDLLRIGDDGAFVLAKILGLILAVGKHGPVLARPGAGVKDTAAGSEFGCLRLHPLVTRVRFWTPETVRSRCDCIH